MDLEQFADDIAKSAIKAGADEADAYIETGRESEVASRMGKTETIKEASSQGYGLRVFRNKRLGFCHSSDFSANAMAQMIDKAISLTDETSSDEYNGLAEFAKTYQIPDLDLFDPEIAKIPSQWKIAACLEAEQAMMDFDKRVVNSEGAGFYDGEETVLIANSRGQQHSFKSSHCHMAARPIAMEDGKMQSNWWFSSKRYFGELDRPQEIARIAAGRAVRMLGARKGPTASVPVIFDTITASHLLGTLAGAIDGDAVYKKATFLAGKLGTQIASPMVTIIDDALMIRGLGSAPFDGDGLPTGRKEVVRDGNLLSYLYDTYTARKSKTDSTSNAHRDYTSMPSIGPFNFYLQAGKFTFDEIIKSVKSGLYVTALMGAGTNIVTGDYSLGASGIWIENGELAYPVEGMTVAANMLDILKRIDMVADDLKFMGGISSPTFRVSEMTVSGT